MNNIQNLAKKTFLELLILFAKTMGYLLLFFCTFILLIQNIKQLLGRKNKKSCISLISNLEGFLTKVIQSIFAQPFYIKPIKVLL